MNEQKAGEPAYSLHASEITAFCTPMSIIIAIAGGLVVMTSVCISLLYIYNCVSVGYCTTGGGGICSSHPFLFQEEI